MSQRFRTSKFKNLTGSSSKAEDQYTELPNISSETSDQNQIKSGHKLLAFQLESAGNIGILPLARTGKIMRELCVVSAHSGNVGDFDFSPFDNHLLATGGASDAKLCVFSLARNDIVQKNTIASSQAVFSVASAHQKSVNVLRFNPAVNRLLATAGGDSLVKLWDVEKGCEVAAFGEDVNKDVASDITWSYDGKLLVSTGKDKDKFIRVWDARSKSVVGVAEGHQGVKASRATWMGYHQNKFITTGFSKTRDRQWAMWDIKDLSKPMLMTTLDQSTGVVVPIFDPDTDLFFFVGKGDTTIRFFETSERNATKAPWYYDLAVVSGKEQTRGVCAISKFGLNTEECEVVRLLRLTPKTIEPWNFVIPRKKSREFPDDLYPLTRDRHSNVTIDAWLAGSEDLPRFVSLKPGSLPDSDDEVGNNNNNNNNNSSSPTSNSPVASGSSSPVVSSSVSASSRKTAFLSDDEIKKLKEKESASQPQVVVKVIGKSDEETRKEKEAEEAEARRKEEEEVAKKPPPEEIAKSVAAKVVRSSHYRHISAKVFKKELCYDHLRLSSAEATNYIKANGTFFAFQSQGAGGCLCVWPLSKVGRIPTDVPLITGHTGNIVDFDFDPFDDLVLATGSEDTSIKIWKIPSVNGLDKSLAEPFRDLRGHQHKITVVKFHPTAKNVLCSGSYDGSLKIWDVESGEAKITLTINSSSGNPTDGVVTDMTFNFDGSVIATTSKDQILRIWDPRQQACVASVRAHDSVKGSRLTWCGSRNQIITTGWNKSSERQICLWDSTQLESEKGLIRTFNMDVAAGMLDPYFDDATGVLFCSGKGDGTIRTFEINDEAPFIHHLVNDTQSKPALGVTLLPKSLYDVKQVEFMRFLKLTKEAAEPIAWKVPRTRLEFFQDDVYGEGYVSQTPPLTSQQWFAGENKKPILVSLQPSGMEKLSEAPALETKSARYTGPKGLTEAQKNAPASKEQIANALFSKAQANKDPNFVPDGGDKEGVDEAEWD